MYGVIRKSYPQNCWKVLHPFTFSPNREPVHRLFCNLNLMHFWRSYCRRRRHCVNSLTHIPAGYVNLVKLPFSANPWDNVSNNREFKMSPWRRKRECQRNNPFRRPKRQLYTCTTQFLYISLAHCTTYNMKLSNVNVLLTTWPYDDKFLFLSKNLDILKNSNPGDFTNTRESERAEIIA